MNSYVLNTFQEIIHSASLITLGITVLIVLVSIFKPQVFKKFLHDFGQRKYVVSICVFVALLCSTVFVATQQETGNTYVSNNTQHTVSAVDLLQTDQNSQARQIEMKEVATSETIPYPKEQRSDPELAAGQTRLIQAGKNGQKTLVYAVTYQNGQETSKALKSESVSVEAVPEITAVSPGQAAADTARNNYQNSNNDKSSGQSNLPQVKLTCGKDNGNSNPQICLYRN